MTAASTLRALSGTLGFLVVESIAEMQKGIDPSGRPEDGVRELFVTIVSGSRFAGIERKCMAAQAVELPTDSSDAMVASGTVS